MEIQLSHYFTVDTFLNFFTWLAIYFSVRVAVQPWGTQTVETGAVEDEIALEISEDSSDAKPNKEQTWVKDEY